MKAFTRHASFARTRDFTWHTLPLAMYARRARLNEANWVAVTHEPDGSICFVYRPYGTPGMRVFMWVFFLAATAFLFMTVYSRGMPWPLVMIFAVINTAGVVFVLWLTFGITCLRLAANELILEKGLWNFRREKRVPKSSIRAVRQIDDHAEQSEPDSFPSFSLRLECEPPFTILSRQDSDRSDYLGTEIAQWAGVPYVSAGKRQG